jgi:ABC-type uncharacterized transport system auxiliary subunit
MKRILWLSAALVAAALLVSGCMGGSPNLKVSQYTLEYEPPEIEGDMLRAVVEVKRFSVAPEYNTNKIVYRDGPYKRSEYVYQRWRANPSDLTTFFLLRDFTRSGLFLNVTGQEGVFPEAYVVEGSVDEFYELDTDEGWKAVLGLTVTLLKASEPDVTKRVLFQRSYQVEEPCAKRNPVALAEAMSRAMQQVSGDIIVDVWEAVAESE